MRFVPHWARAQVGLDGKASPTGPVVAFGWSAESSEAAEAHAEERADNLARRLRELVSGRRGPELTHLREYYCHGDRPMREPIVEEFERRGQRVAAITRNGYGCYVLNTTGVMFIDIDLPKYRPEPQPGLVRRLFGARRAPAPSRAEREAPVRERIRRVMARHPEVGMRLYRTKNGFRGLVTSALYEPSSSAATSLMTELESDPLYMTLCRVQDCFRARITPKPWRLGIGAAPHAFFPWQDDPARRRDFDEWDAIYDEVRRHHIVCEEVTHHGPSPIHEDVRDLFEVHERWSCGVGELS